MSFFGKSFRLTEPVVDMLERMSDLSTDELDIILEQAAKEAAPSVRAAINTNKNKAGIGDDTGSLSKNIKRIVIDYLDGIFTYRFPSNPTIEEDGYKSRRQFFAAAQSLHSGRVVLPQVRRTTGDIVVGGYGQRHYQKRAIASQKAKKSIKKLALTGEIKDKAKRAIERGSKYRTGVETGPVKLTGVERREKEGSIKYGDASVVRPRPYFELSNGQVNAVAHRIIKYAEDEIIKTMNNA